MNNFFLFSGHCGVHQEGIRQEVQPDVALYCGPQLWIVRNARDPSLYLLLFGSGSDSALQERLRIMSKCNMENRDEEEDEW